METLKSVAAEESRQYNSFRPAITENYKLYLPIEIHKMLEGSPEIRIIFTLTPISNLHLHRN